MVQAQILRLLRALQAELELAVLFITHDLSTLAAACRRLAVMYAGRIVEEGPAREVFAAPAHPYTRALAAAFPVIGDPAFRHNPSGLPGDPPDPRELPPGCPFHPRCPVVREECPRTAVELWPAGPGRRAACVEVLAAIGERAAARAARPARPLRRPQGRGRARRRRRRPGAARGRGARARRRVGLRQDDARAHDHGPRAPGGRRGALPRRAAALRPPLAARVPARGADGVPGPDRRAERAPDDLRGGRGGAADPEGRRRRGGAGRRGAVARRTAPARALLRALPLRGLRRAAPARRDRRRDGARSRGCSSPTSRSRASTRRCAARSSR